MTKTIELNSRMDYQSVLRNVGRLGVLRVDNQYERNGITYVSLHERTWGEWLSETFLAKPKDLASTRQAVANALAPIIQKQARPPEQLVQNIRDRVAHGVDITGRGLARDFAPVTAGKNPKPLQGGTVVARGTGHGVRVLGAPPAAIRCDHAILRGSTAAVALQAKNQLHLVRELNKIAHPSAPDWVGQTVAIPGAPAGTWSCIDDVKIPASGAGKAVRSPEQLQADLATVLDGKRGAVVVELLPDTCTEKGGVKSWHCSDAGMKAQWQIAEKAVEAAKIAQGALVISFASENVDELKRMKDVVRQEPGTVMTGNLAMPIYLSDDDSDSDSDDDIPIENFVKVGPQNKTPPPTEG